MKKKMLYTGGTHERGHVKMNKVTEQVAETEEESQFRQRKLFS